MNVEGAWDVDGAHGSSPVGISISTASGLATGLPDSACVDWLCPERKSNVADSGGASMFSTSGAFGAESMSSPATVGSWIYRPLPSAADMGAGSGYGNHTENLEAHYAHINMRKWSNNFVVNKHDRQETCLPLGIYKNSFMFWGIHYFEKEFTCENHFSCSRNANACSRDKFKVEDLDRDETSSRDGITQDASFY